MREFTLNDNNIIALLSSANPELGIDLFEITENDITINEEALGKVKTNIMLQGRLITHLFGNLGVIPGITNPAEAKAYAPILHILCTLLPVDDYHESWESFIANQNSRNTIYTVLQDVLSAEKQIQEAPQHISYIKILLLISDFLSHLDPIGFETYCVQISIVSYYDHKTKKQYIGTQILHWIFPPTVRLTDTDITDDNRAVITNICDHIVATPLIEIFSRGVVTEEWKAKYISLITEFSKWLPNRLIRQALTNQPSNLPNSPVKAEVLPILTELSGNL